MVCIQSIPVFKGVKNEDPESFLRNYKNTCISTWSRIIENWITFLPQFLEIRVFDGIRNNRELPSYFRII